MIDSVKLKDLLSRLCSIKEDGILDGEEADRSENLHRLFMYPAMMVPATQSAMIEALTHILPSGSMAIDPFMGSGTSLLSCMEFGFNVYGQDINPFAVLLSKAKVTSYDLEGFRKSLQSIEEHIANDKTIDIDVSFYNLDKWFKKEVQVSLSKIRRAIQAEECPDYRNFFWVVMSEVIRIGSNDRTSTFKLHIRDTEDIANRNIDIIKDFLCFSERGIEDLSNYRDKLQEEHLLDGYRFSGVYEVLWGNTQKEIKSEKKFDLLVSSPPYGDNHTTVTYGQTSYLPLQWIDPKDIICPYDYLKTTQEIDRQSLGGHIKSKSLQKNMERLFEKSSSLANFYAAIPEKDRGKYKKTISFIADFDDSLDVITKSMKSDAFYIWTIGNRFVDGREVPNDRILNDLMECRGISLFFDAERRILNKKQARRNSSSQTMEKEQILIFHKNI